MKRKSSSGVSLNLDSLLDTLTNVVGFLVILLALMQLGVGEAVKKIHETLENLIEAATPEAVAAAELKLAENIKLLEAKAAAAELAKQQTVREAAMAESPVAAMVAPVEQARETTLSVEELAKQLAEQEAFAKQVAEKLAAAVAELQKLKGALDDAPAVQGDPEAKIINLPNPRSAPDGARVAYFVCRAGRTLFVDVEGLQERSKKAAMFVLKGSFKPNGEVNEIDCEKLTAHFEKTQIVNKYIRVKVIVWDGTPLMSLERKPDAGDTPAALARGSSDTWRYLKQAQKENRYARFLVWPDGFEAYLAARQVAEKVKIPSGWEPQTRADEWPVGFSIALRCKGAPPPAPPPPAPATPAPTVSVPADVVD